MWNRYTIQIFFFCTFCWPIQWKASNKNERMNERTSEWAHCDRTMIVLVVCRWVGANGWILQQYPHNIRIRFAECNKIAKIYKYAIIFVSDTSPHTHTNYFRPNTPIWYWFYITTKSTKDSFQLANTFYMIEFVQFIFRVFFFHFLLIRSSQRSQLIWILCLAWQRSFRAVIDVIFGFGQNHSNHLNAWFVERCVCMLCPVDSSNFSRLMQLNNLL